MKKMMAISFCALFGFGDKNTENVVIPKNFYELKAISLQGKEISMETYKGKVVLIVNTASKCGFTPQYAGLEELYQKYKEKGLVILGFPCNQFLKQEPGTSDEIQNFCQINYGVSFQMFEKIEVNGANTHPIYRFLKNALPGKITWNFNKFIVDKNGIPYKRYPSQTIPKDLEKDIEFLLAK